MSPEQAGGNRQLLDHRTDIYSLGATFYELLVLRPVFGSLDRQELLREIAAVEPLAPRKVSRSVPVDLQTICLKALEKEPSQRYATAGALANDLRRYLEGKSIAARRPGVADHVAKWSRRHASAIAASMLVVLIAIGAAVGFLWRENAWTRANLKLAEDAATEQLRLTQIAERRRQLAERAAQQERAQRKLADESRRRAERAEATEKQRREQLEEQQRISEAVLAFLRRDLLLQADPRAQSASQDDGWAVRENPTIRELLDRAAAQLAPGKIEAKFANLPSVQAAILETVGETYCGIGNYAEAISHLTRATEIYQASLGDDHRATNTCREKLACAHALAGDLELAIPLHERAVKALEATLGNEHVVTLESQGMLGVAYQKAGNLDLAITLLERTLTAQESKLGEHHESTLRSRHNLARAYQDAGRSDLAVPLLERTLESSEESLGPDHPDTLVTRSCLAEAYGDAGRRDLAIALLERTLSDCTARLGDDHPDTIDARSRLAVEYVNAGKLEVGIPMLERALKMSEVKLGDEHPETLTTRSSMALAYQSAGRLDLALPLGKRTYEARESKLGPGHPATLRSMNNLAFVYWRSGQLDRSVPLFEEALRRQREKLGPNHPTTVVTQANLGINYRDAGRAREAVAPIEDALDRMRSRPGGWPAANFAGLRRELAKTYLVAGDHDKAVRLFTEHLNDQREKSGAESSQFAAELATVGTELLNHGLAASAEPLLRECLAIRETQLPDDWSNFNASSLLGGCLLGQKKFADAEPLLVAGYEGMRKREAQVPPPAKIRIPEALERVVRLYEQQDKPEEAANWRAKEPLGLAQLAASRKQHRPAADLYRAAFDSRSDLAADPAVGNRYNAACAAALAADGQGTDAEGLTAEARVAWRKQALEWLRADLDAWRERLAAATEAEPPRAVQVLAHWQKDADLASVRDEQALAKLPEEERNAWQALWHDVAELIADAMPGAVSE